MLLLQGASCDFVQQATQRLANQMTVRFSHHAGVFHGQPTLWRRQHAHCTGEPPTAGCALCSELAAGATAVPGTVGRS